VIARGRSGPLAGRPDPDTRTQCGNLVVARGRSGAARPANTKYVGKRGDDHDSKDADVHHGLNSFPYILFRGSIKSETSA
jgi:hypothetical protein